MNKWLNFYFHGSASACWLTKAAPSRTQAPWGHSVNKYLLIDWQKDLLGPGKSGCWTEWSDTILWLVYRNLCLFTSPDCGMSTLIGRICIKRLVTLPAPRSWTSLKGRGIGPLPGALSVRARVGFSTRKVELCWKNYSFFALRGPPQSFKRVREKNKNISLLAGHAEE